MGRFAGDVADLTAKRLRADAQGAVTPIVSEYAGPTRLTPILAAAAAEKAGLKLLSGDVWPTPTGRVRAPPWRTRPPHPSCMSWWWTMLR